MKTKVQHVNPIPVTEEKGKATIYPHAVAIAVASALNTITTPINDGILDTAENGMNWKVENAYPSGWVVVSEDKNGSAGTAGVPVYFVSAFSFCKGYDEYTANQEKAREVGLLEAITPFAVKNTPLTP